MVALFRPDERRATETSLLSAVERWAALEHPALPSVVDAFVDGSSMYIVTDFVAGWSLRDTITEQFTLTPELVRNWGAQLCQLFAYLHERSEPVFAPFLAPHHVMVTSDGLVKLADWGLSAILSPNSYGPYGSIRGYMAPELRTDAPTAQSDVFALARLLYALLTGQLLERGVQHAPTLRKAAPGISPDLAKALSQASSRNPSARPTVSALLSALWPAGIPAQPIRDWFQAAAVDDGTADPEMVSAPAPAPSDRKPTGEYTASMADLGFVRDARFGPKAEAVPPPAPQGSGPPPAAKARLTVQPRAFSIQRDAPNQRQRLILTLRNSGDADLIAGVSSRVDWIKAPQKTVRLSPRQQAKVILTAVPSELPSGAVEEPHALAVNFGGSRIWVSAAAEVPAGPSLIIGEPMLDFGVLEAPGERTMPLVIRNIGRVPMSGTVVSRVPWLTIPNGAFRCAGGQAVSVAVRLEPNTLPPGEQSADSALLVESDGGQMRVRARAWYKRPALDLGTRQLDFDVVKGGDQAERFLYVRNPGDGTLDAQARSLLPWLQVQPARFRCSPGETCELSVQLDTVGLSDGDIAVPQALRIQSNAGNVTLSLRVGVRAPRLTLDASQIDFGSVPLGEDRTVSFALRNTGSAPLEATIQSLVPWLSADQTSVTCSAGETCLVRAHAQTAGFARGEEFRDVAAIRVTSESAVREIAAHLVVTQPTLRVEPDSIEFGYIERAAAQSHTLTLANDGNGPLAWNASSSTPWVEISPRQGVCESGKSQSVTLTAYGLALEAESASASGNVVINSDGGRAKIDLHVGIAKPTLDVDTTALALGPSINGKPVSGEIYLFNRGLGVLMGTIAVDRPWLVPDRVSFECATGRSFRAGLATDMPEFPSGATRDTALLRISSNGGDAEVRVSLEVLSAPEITVGQEGVVLKQQVPGGPMVGTLTIRNTGMAPAYVTLASKDTGLELPRSDYEIKPGKSVRVRLMRTVSAPDASEKPFNLTITSPSETISVPVLLEQPTPGEQSTRKEIPR